MSGDDGMPPIDLSIWRDQAIKYGQDPEQIGRDAIAMVAEGIELHPRSQQRELGPSELGHPCQRWLAHRLAGTPATGIQAPKLRAALGTASHVSLSDWCHAYNERHGFRYLTDLKVTVGELYPGRIIKGTLDIFDVWYGAVVDGKFPGPNGMKTYAYGKPESEQYRRQVLLYGKGAEDAGFRPAFVGMLRIPAAGELRDATWRYEPYDRALAEETLTRAGGVAQMVNVLGTAAIPLQPTTQFHCGTCPFYLPNATDLTRACPGAEDFVPRFGQPGAVRSINPGPPKGIASLIA